MQERTKRVGRARGVIDALGIRLLIGCGVAIGPLACGEDRPPPKDPPAAELCEVDDECQTGRCDPRTGCVECLFDHDCADGERCDERACREVIPCDDASDCGGASYPVCELGAGECVACLEDGDCGGTAHCVEYRCEVYDPCAVDADCAEGVCDTARGQCVECVERADCGGERACVDNFCVTPCARERDCSLDEPICGPAGYCVECAVHAHCPDVYHCAEGRCAIDVCENADQRCGADERAVETCAASGSGYVAAACDPRQSCTSASGDPECVDWMCEPESERCNSDATELEVCSANGLTIASRTDCAERGEICIAGDCIAPTCEPGEVSCEDGDLYRCSDDGTERQLEQACSVDELCNAAEQTCIPLLCQANTLVCDGDTVRSCNEDGTGYTGDPLACDATEACFEGACLPRICVGSYLCDGEKSRRCADAGTRLELVETCSIEAAEPTYCNPDTGRCELVGCDPSQPICVGNVATVCADDGSAPIAGGIDCEDLGEVCFNGGCFPELCTEEYVCERSDLYHCEDNGSALLLSGECGRPELCDANAGICLPEVCTPGDPICNGNIATTCDETGAGYEPGGTDCSESGQACHGGTCADVVCAPDEYLCVEGDVHRCNLSGTASDLVADCGTGEHCTNGASACEPNACSPGAGVCNGTVATTCREDGSGPEDGGVDCAETGEACRLGECEPLICTSSERFCEGGHVRVCNSSGTASAPYETCLESEYCDDTATVTCRPRRCTPSAAACSGETLAVCNEDGSGYASTSTNCALTGEVCDLVNACGPSAIDTVGSAGLSSENPMPTLHLTVLDVLIPRTLTEVRSYFAVAANTQVAWLVYEAVDNNRTYEKALELAATATAGVAMFHSSGELNVVLQAGHSYAMGVLVQGAHTEYQGLSPAEPLSFATVIGPSRTTIAAVPDEITVDVNPTGMGFQTIVTERTPTTDLLESK
jgi:hypothetical protein